MKPTAKKSKSRKSKHVFSWLNPKLEVRQSSIQGKGLFAKKDIKKGGIICVMGGYIMDLFSIYDRNNEIMKHDHVQIDDYFGIGKMEKTEDTANINHSCNPNSGFKRDLVLVSMRKIKKNEEVTFDYAMETSHPRGIKQYKFICNCSAKNCRGIMTGNDWKRLELQKRYKGYFQSYIQEKIDCLNKK